MAAPVRGVSASCGKGRTSWFNKRPLVLCCLAFALGIGLCTVLRFTLVQALVPAALLLAACTAMLCLKKKIPMALLAVLLVAVGGVRCAACVHPYRGDGPGSELSMVKVSGRICETPVTDTDSTLLVLDRVTVGDTAIGQRVQLRLYHRGEEAEDIPSVCYGDSVLWYGDLKVPRSQTNPYGNDPHTNAMRRGVRYTASGSWHEVELTPGKSDVRGFFLQVRSEAGRYVDEKLGLSSGAAVMKALLLGQDEDIDDRVWTDMRHLGIVHILSVSGLHVSLLTAALFWVCKRLRLPAKVQVAAAGVFLLLYCMLTGFSAPITRAAFMAGMVLSASVLYRRSDPLTSWALAGGIILAAAPLEIVSVGFQLSFLCVAALLALVRTLPSVRAEGEGFKPAAVAKMRNFGRGIINALAVTLTVQLAVWPVLAFHFSSVPLLGLLTNLVAVPLCSVLMIGGGGLLVLAAIPPLAPLCAQLLNGFTDFWLQALSNAAALPYMHVQLPAPKWWVLAAWAVFMMSLSRYLLVKGRKRLLIVGVSAVIAAAGLMLPNSQVRLLIPDVGQGHAAVVLDGEHCVIYDTGPTIAPGYDSADAVLLPLLRGEGVDRVEVLLLSHGDDDHMGGAATLMRSMSVDTAVIGADPASPAWEPVRAAAEETGTALVYAAAGQVYETPNLRFCVTQGGEHADGNLASMVVRMEDRAGSGLALFTGDRDNGTVRTDGAVQVVQMPHHGSLQPQTEGWLEAAQPRYVYISCGLGNKFGHPVAETLEMLRRLDLCCLRTDESGCLRFVLRDGLMVYGEYDFVTWEVGA